MSLFLYLQALGKRNKLNQLAKNALATKLHHMKVMNLFPIAHAPYIKIQLETIDITTRIWGYDIRICMVYIIKPCSDVYCFKLNFNISNMGYFSLMTISPAQLKECDNAPVLMHKLSAL